MTFKMEIDPSDDMDPFSAKFFITQRLEAHGVPREYLKRLQSGLISYYKENRSKLPDLVSAILATDDTDDIEAVHFPESMVWLQWLMFEKDPEPVLENLIKSSVGQRGVCGAVWGNNDIAYRCRTCEHDPTCAICVPCFQNGEHKDHDYSIMYTGGGCCDCGDVTAWKRNGFCSKHKGVEQIQPLSKELADSIGPVLDLLFSYWKCNLTVAENIYIGRPKIEDYDEETTISDDLSTAVVEMLMELCNCTESLLSFISERVLSSVGLLDILVRAERYLVEEDVRKLQGLLLKMLSDPSFKYEFAKVFLDYYPTVLNEAIKKSDDVVFKKYPLMSTFSVQIFTVPTLTPRLVKERNLLVLLFNCLENIFVACAGKDERLDINKWGNLYETTFRVVEDIRFVMSHAVVPRYVTYDRRDIVKMWMKILAFMQGMNPQKRETGIHIEQENENMHLPFVLGHTVANIHSLLVAGGFSESSVEGKDDEKLFNTYKTYSDSPRYAKVGRHSEESSVSSKNIIGSTSRVGNIINPDVLLCQPIISCLTNECLKAIEIWLTTENTSGDSPGTADMVGNNFFALKETLSKFRRGTSLFRSYDASSNSSKVTCISDMEVERGIEQGVSSANFGEKEMEIEYATTEIEALRLSDWPNISYDVSSLDISVHIPLHRLLSMIIHRAAKKCFGELRSPRTVDISSLDASSDFFKNILNGLHPHGFSAFIMEHPLRIRVFCAQVLAGMWKKNGDASIYSWEWYRSARWSEQGLELDLFMLQCCAALAPADLYVSRFLERFQLTDYLNLDVERFNEFEPVLMQEMLALIIQIVKERRFCGLSATECLQRELIFKLAIGNATHSQLVKSLPRELSRTDRLQEILDKVARYSTPSGMKQGMYKLRLEFWKELDLYHPRWSSREMQIADERYLRFCKTSALTSQLPKWTDTYEPFNGIARIATCKVVLQIIRSVLFYSVYTNRTAPSLAPDSLLVTALHLLSLALDICFRARESSNLSVLIGNSLPILAFAAEELSGDVSLLSLLVSAMRMHQKESAENFTEAGSFNVSSLVGIILKKMAELDSVCMTKLQKLAPEVVSHLSHFDSRANQGVSEVDKRKAKARERQAAIMEKMRAQQSKFMESIIPTSTNELDESKSEEASPSNTKTDSEESTQNVCSLCHDSSSKIPLCYFILLQKSNLQSLVDKSPPSWKDIGYVDKEQLLEISSRPDQNAWMSNPEQISSPQSNQLVQSAIDEFASGGHPREVNAFVESIKARFPSVRNILLPGTSSNPCGRTESSLETLEEQIYLTISEQVRLNLELDQKFPLVNERGRSEVAESAFFGKYIATLSKETFDNTLTLGIPKSAESIESSKPLSYFLPLNCDGIHISSCGHVVHQACLDRYLSSVKEMYLRRNNFQGRHNADPDQGEFLCPVCRGLSNSVLPALPRDSQKFLMLPMDATMREFDSANYLTSENKQIRNLLVREAFSLLNCATDVVERSEICKALPIEHIGRVSPNLESVFRVLSGMYFRGKDGKSLGSERVNHCMIMWDTLKYSLMSTEIASRCRSSSLSPNYSVDALFNELKSSKGFILSLLLKIVLGTRNTNSLGVLLRLRGIQLFAESVCFGASIDELASHSLKSASNMSAILKRLGREEPYPDIEFLRRASDPIISSDAFSSLMWVLFCLPSRFLSCKSSFLSLVHLFYGVSVAQAIVTYLGKFKCDMSELGCDGVLIMEIFKIMQGCGFAKQFFISNHLDCSFDIKTIIRGLTFPYLRRCGLLWNIINASVSAPFSGVHPEHSLSHASDVMIEDVNEKNVDPVEFEALEKMFEIPSLDIVINDEVLCLLVSRWLRHFNKEYEVRYAQAVLPMTPAVPFKLMNLPNVYHDLLQRYIKQNCRDCNSAIEEPTLCFLCGKLCSPNWKPCCRENDCHKHAMTCGAGIGIFLLVRKTTVLLYRDLGQAAWPSPYLDAFGEEDKEMNRGKPLYLNEERYAFLTYMVASHGFDRISQDLRQMTLGL